jgi:TonB-linked SusC/RagA family outer membrane protein
MEKTIFRMKRILLLVVAVGLSGVLFAQSKAVSGKVTDTTGESVIGVSVAVKGTTTGTVTDIDGAYRINVPEVNSVLVFSYIGMITQEIVPASDVLNVTLQEDVQNLDELVVIGYGTMKRRDLTGAVASIKIADLQGVATNNAMQAMQGKVAGLDIQQKAGAGEGITMKLRGNRSINAGNDPLVIVDGVEYGSTIDLNTSDIASMEVLKDASSTAIYGTRGANGVIIITTKRGGEPACGQKTRVTYNGYVSANSPTLVPRSMTGQEEFNLFVDRQRYLDYNSGDPDKVAKAGSRSNYTIDDLNQLAAGGQPRQLYEDGISVDWFDELLHNSTSQNHEVSVSGGGDKTSVNFSIGYLDENGLMKSNELKRYNSRLTIDQIISPTVKAGASAIFSRRDWDRRSDGAFSQAVKLHTLADKTRENAVSELMTSHHNPLNNEKDNNYVNNTVQNRLLGNVYFNWEIIPGLNFKSSLSVDTKNTFQGIYEDMKLASKYQSDPHSRITQENTGSYSLTWDNTLNYAKTFAGLHDLSLLLGNSVNKNEALWTKLGGTADEHLNNGFYELSSLTTNDAPEDKYTASSMLSYFGRVNYSYNSRYLLQATLRADGSSVLAEGHQWGYFPSASAGWRISEEDFIAGSAAIDNLKLRYSWGLSGNAAISPYQTLSTLAGFPSRYSFGDVAVFGFIPGQIGNEELTWETTGTHDIGLDFGFLKNRISGSIDLYYSTTNNLLLYKTLPPTSAYPATWDNIGSTENRGIEVVLNTANINGRNFKWSSDWAFTLNRDKVTGLASGTQQDYSNVDRALKVGEPVFCFLDYEADGAYTQVDVDAANAHFDATGETLLAYGKNAGEEKIIDQDGNGFIDDLDRILYNQSPDFIFGWNNHFSYKGVALDVLTYARVGQWMNYDLYEQGTKTDGSAIPGNIDYWTPENQNSRFPQLQTASTHSTAYHKVKASYWKIKDITLSYTLPKAWLKPVRIANLRIYGSMKNWFTFSNIDNYDPEQNGSISNALMKQVVVGLNLEF